VEKAFPLFDHACETGKISKAAVKSFAVRGLCDMWLIRAMDFSVLLFTDTTRFDTCALGSCGEGEEGSRNVVD
jgi:hypothetical protein